MEKMTAKKKKADSRNDRTKNKHKNCEIFMCQTDGTLNAQDRTMMKELHDIFSRSSSRYTRIGVESHNAYALIVKGYKENRIVIKIPRKKDGTVDSLKYEYITGCDVRKQLCRVLPNFMKVYGYVHKNDDEYLILQRILPGTSFRELICDPDAKTEYRSIYSPFLQSLVLQTLAALQVAQERIGFVHYDLHFGNIVIKKVPRRTFSLVYKYKDRFGKKKVTRVPVYNGHVAVIIDFGRSRTHQASQFLYDNDEFFKPYRFLLKPKYNRTDIRTFDPIYDAKRFCSILTKYVHDFDYDANDINEPHDVIRYIKQHYRIRR